MEYLDHFGNWIKSLSPGQAALVIGCTALGVVGFIVFLAWFFSPKPRGEKYSILATVEEKTYAPSRRSSGTGVGVTPGGSIGTVSTSSNTPQSFNIVFITDQKDVIVANDKKAYGQLKVGQKVKIWLQPYRYFGSEKDPVYISFELV